MSKTHSAGLRTRAKRANFWLQALMLASAGVLPLLSSANVSAAQLTDRSVTISTSEPSATNVTHTFDFTVPGDATTAQSIEFQYCSTPLGTCTNPWADLDVSSAAIDGTPTGLTGWAVGTNTANTIQLTRTDASNVTVDTDVQVALNGISNPEIETTIYDTFYIRVSVYEDSAYTTVRDTGTVAGVVTQQLTINGRVQERLEFCVAALGNADATPADCDAFPTDTNIDIGVIEEAIAVSPVANDGFNGADDDYGIAMVDTNAGGGVTISYFPEADDIGTNQLRNFRIDDSAACDALETSEVDTCFQSAATGGTDLSAAGERFGMHIACVDRTASEANTANLLNNVAAYQADASDATCEDTEASTTYAWDNTGNATQIASSSTVVNDEMLKMRFAARAAATTPTGNYTVTTTYVATATF